MSDLLLTSLSGGVVAGPAVHGIVTVREHIIVVNRPGDVLTLESLKILSWSGIESNDFSLIAESIGVFDQSVHVLEVHLGIGKSEVAAEWQKHVVAPVVSGHLMNVINKLLQLSWSIIGIQIFINYVWIITIESLIIRLT